MLVPFPVDSKGKLFNMESVVDSRIPLPRQMAAGESPVWGCGYGQRGVQVQISPEAEEKTEWFCDTHCP